MKTAAGDCPGETHSQQQEIAPNIQVRGCVWTEQVGGRAWRVNSKCSWTHRSTAVCQKQHRLCPRCLCNVGVSPRCPPVWPSYTSHTGTPTIAHHSTHCEIQIHKMTLENWSLYYRLKNLLLISFVRWCNKIPEIIPWTLTLVQSQASRHRSGRRSQSFLLVHLHPGQTSSPTPSPPGRWTRITQLGWTYSEQYSGLVSIYVWICLRTENSPVVRLCLVPCRWATCPGGTVCPGWDESPCRPAGQTSGSGPSSRQCHEWGRRSPAAKAHRLGTESPNRSETFRHITLTLTQYQFQASLEALPN